MVCEHNSSAPSDFDNASHRINNSGIRYLDTEVCEPAEYSHQVTTNFKYLFANVHNEDEGIYPVTVSDIVDCQKEHRLYKKYFKDKPFKDQDKYIRPKVVTDTIVLVHSNLRLVIPGAEMQSRIVQWYQHYLQHPGETRLEETIVVVMYWPNRIAHIRKHVKNCDRCQLGKRYKREYRYLPPKIATITPWKQVCVDLVGPYIIKAKDGNIMDFMCLTMIDPATSWFEIVELPNRDVTYVGKKYGKEIVEVFIDKIPASVACLFNKSWLSRYPRAHSIIYDNGSKFKLFFEDLCESYSLKRKPNTIKNPQANAIIERVHAVVTNMMQTAGLVMSDTCTPEMINELLTNVGWAIQSTHHTVLGTSPGAAIFGRDILFDVPYIADWSEIGKRR